MGRELPESLVPGEEQHVVISLDLRAALAQWDVELGGTSLLREPAATVQAEVR